MDSILEALYNANIIDMSEDDSRLEAMRRKSASYTRLISALDDKQKDLLERYCAAQSELEEITCFQTFTSGFKVGILLMQEVSAPPGLND